MFSEAVKLISPCFKPIMSGKGASSGGGGCVYVSSDVVVTANHIVENESEIMVVGEKGFYAASVVWSSHEHDFAILKRGALIEAIRNASSPSKFPPAISNSPEIGTSVGYLGTLSRRTHEGKEKSPNVFVSSHISFQDLQSAGKFIALEPTFFEQGFSGGPVFTKDGHIVGVISKSFDIKRNCGAKDDVCFPMIAPIHYHLSELNDAINTR